MSDDGVFGCISGMEKKKRYIIGGCCIGGGLLCSIIGFALFTVSKVAFAFIYVIGLVLSFVGSFFIVGPKKHIEAFKIKEHVFATIGAVCSIVLIFVFVFIPVINWFAIIFVVTQIISTIFFNLTLTPESTEKMKSVLSKCFKCCKKDGSGGGGSGTNEYV